MLTIGLLNWSTAAVDGRRRKWVGKKNRALRIYKNGYLGG